MLEPATIVDGVNSAVSALLVSGSDLYIGGSFNQVDTANGFLLTPHVVRWRSGAWNALASGLNLELVLSLGMSQGKLYVGTRSASVYRFDEQTLSRWHAINFSGFDGNPISALADVQGNLYVGGTFSQIAGIPNAASNAWALYQAPVIFASGFDQ